MEVVILSLASLAILTTRLIWMSNFGVVRYWLSASLLSSLALWFILPPFSHHNYFAASRYVSHHPKLSPKVQQAILNGKVIAAMTPEQATVAGGRYFWVTEKGKLASMTFSNLSQFDSGKAVTFKAFFKDDRVERIERISKP